LAFLQKLIEKNFAKKLTIPCFKCESVKPIKIIGGATMKWMTVKRFNLVLLTIILMATLILPVRHAYAQAIKLTLVSGWPTPVAFNDKLKVFVQRVNEGSKGKVFIDYKGGPEIAPITEQAGLVKDGVFDMAHTTPGYYAGLCPESVPLYYAPPDPVLLRRIGVTSLADQFHRERMGVTFLGFVTRGEHFTIVSKKPITSANFSGIKMHTLPIYTAPLTYLGAKTVTLTVAEFYTALETGVVDAIPCPTATVPMDYKLYEVAKYILFPPMPITTTGYILVNGKRWDGLPGDVRKLITENMVELEKEVLKHFEGLTAKRLDELVAKGMEIVKLPPPEAKKYQYAFTEYAWEKFSEKNPKWVPKLYELCKPYLGR
jgi:TRAP-type C4-dicarboxylate transport system substrate-binding protein